MTGNVVWWWWTRTQALRAALALPQDRNPAAGGRTLLREAPDAPVPAGAAGAGVGLPGIPGQQDLSVAGDAVFLPAAVDGEQRLQCVLCGRNT